MKKSIVPLDFAMLKLNIFKICCGFDGKVHSGKKRYASDHGQNHG